MVRVVFLAVMRKLGEKANELTDTLVNRIGLHVRISVQRLVREVYFESASPT